jgi:hypothetical protein
MKDLCHRDTETRRHGDTEETLKGQALLCNLSIRKHNLSTYNSGDLYLN